MRRDRSWRTRRDAVTESAILHHGVVPSSGNCLGNSTTSSPSLSPQCCQARHLASRHARRNSRTPRPPMQTQAQATVPPEVHSIRYRVKYIQTRTSRRKTTRGVPSDRCHHVSELSLMPCSWKGKHGRVITPLVTFCSPGRASDEKQSIPRTRSKKA